jgi:hypothetical protein
MFCINYYCRDIVVGTATGYGLDNQGVKSSSPGGGNT